MLQGRGSLWLATFVARRVALLAALLLLLSFFIFSLLYLAPGSAVRSLLGTHPATAQTIRAITIQYHLNRPFLVQYWDWLTAVAHLNLGTSIQTEQPVAQLIGQRLGVTGALIAGAFAISVILGVTSGVIAAVREGRPSDRLIVAGTIVGVSVPTFVSGLILLFVFAAELHLFPAVSITGASLSTLVLPTVALAMSVMALLTRIARAAMIREWNRDHITFARARGLSFTRVLLVHGVRNALLPVVTSAGLIVSLLFGGTVLIETVFSLNGVGALLVSSVDTHDFPVVQAIALIVAATIVTLNLLVDLSYLALDPRVRLGRRG